MTNTPQGPPGEPVTSTPQEHLGDSVKLVLTPPDEEPSQSNPDEESQLHDTHVTIPEVNEHEGEGDGEGDKSEVTEVASSVDESRVDTPPTDNSKLIESETQKLTNEEIPNEPVVFVTGGGDGESEIGGEGETGGESETRAEGETGGESETKGEDETGGESETRGEDETGGESETKGEGETGGEDEAGSKDGSEVIGGGEDDKGEEEQSTEVKVEVKSSDKQEERSSPTEVKSKTTSELKRYKTLVISTI